MYTNDFQPIPPFCTNSADYDSEKMRVTKRERERKTGRERERGKERERHKVRFNTCFSFLDIYGSAMGLSANGAVE